MVEDDMEIRWCAVFFRLPMSILTASQLSLQNRMSVLLRDPVFYRVKRMLKDKSMHFFLSSMSVHLK